jgi:hypothetical protein
VLCILREINESYVMSLVHQGGRGLQYTTLWRKLLRVLCGNFSREKSFNTSPKPLLAKWSKYIYPSAE